jgi:integrase/recombinase XerD
MLLSEAIQGFLLHAESGVYSPHYIPTMKIQLTYICKYFADPELESLTPAHWEKYIHHLHTEYQPKRFNGSTAPLALSTIDNHWKTIRGFYNWASKVLSIDRPDLTMPRPKYDSPEIVPYSEDEVKKLLAACQYTQVIKQSGRTYRIKRQNGDRDRTILLILLDTGVRLGEFTRLRVGDVNLENGEIYVRSYRSGRKSKARTIYIGNRTKEAIWKYIAKQQAQPNTSEPLFRLKPASIRILINRIGHNAKVNHAHPQRFRDTFATNYYRNSRDVFALQRVLGHRDIKMTMKYVHLVESDIAKTHRIASPVDNWKL